MSKKVLIISGPTASGKTAFSIEAAKEYNCEIVNFDSLLFYKELNIGVAKPSKEELHSIPHHFVSCTSIAETYNASTYIQLALPTINAIHARGKPVILVGGSGFYLQALLQGMYDSPATPQEILEQSENIYQTDGIDPFLLVLKKNDIKSFERYHENDHYRIRRAVEHFWAWKTKFSEARTEKNQQDPAFWPMTQHQWDVFHLYFEIPRETHWSLIEKRTHSMIENGFVEEVKELLNTFTGEEKPLQSIGYKEIQAFLKNKHDSIEVCEELINIATRQLAKSQRTWFKTKSKNKFNPLSDEKNIHQAIKQFFKGSTC